MAAATGSFIRRNLLGVLDTKDVKFQTCAQLKAAHASAPNGYYRMTLSLDRKVMVYCDMEKFGGGWTLVVSISSTSNDHLQQSQHNCLNSELCVPYMATGGFIPRKLSDQDIHRLAATEGVFRVDYADSYTVFYRFPSGQENFNSACLGLSCPRIILSHSHPYVWESNCKGTAVGYRIWTTGGCHRVFDGHDNNECGAQWSSSNYLSERALYGYPCPTDPGHSSLGLYLNKQGLLWVK